MLILRDVAFSRPGHDHFITGAVNNSGGDVPAMAWVNDDIDQFEEFFVDQLRVSQVIHDLIFRMDRSGHNGVTQHFHDLDRDFVVGDTYTD